MGKKAYAGRKIVGSRAMMDSLFSLVVIADLEVTCSY